MGNLNSKTAPIIDVIVSDEPSLRDQSLDSICQDLSREELLTVCEELDSFRRTADNLYHRVRALFFLYAIHRFHLPEKLVGRECGTIPFNGFERLLGRRFQEAIHDFLGEQQASGPSITLSSALASAYHQLAFQTLADQVRKSVRTVKGNQWMFRTGHPDDLPLQIRPELVRVQSDHEGTNQPKLAFIPFHAKLLAPTRTSPSPGVLFPVPKYECL
ncbi:MAG: hypothetical protein AAGG44_00385 [Planctomycetota bacterium]